MIADIHSPRRETWRNKVSKSWKISKSPSSIPHTPVTRLKIWWTMSVQWKRCSLKTHLYDYFRWTYWEAKSKLYLIISLWNSKIKLFCLACDILFFNQSRGKETGTTKTISNQHANAYPKAAGALSGKDVPSLSLSTGKLLADNTSHASVASVLSCDVFSWA